MHVVTNTNNAQVMSRRVTIR